MDTSVPPMPRTNVAMPQNDNFAPMMDGSQGPSSNERDAPLSGYSPSQLPIDENVDAEHVLDARPILPLAAFFMGDLRDGLPMLNMQAAYLISAKAFTEKQVGMLFFVFGISQVVCMTPFGYCLDYSNNKIKWVMWASLAVAALTVITALTARPFAENMGLMIILKALQGGISSILPPGFNGITLGIVGSKGFTHQVSRNRMMNHVGTALVVAIGSLIAYFLYPTIGHLFIVSPLAAIGVYYYLRKIIPHHVNTEAARGLITTSPTMTEYEYMDDENEAMWIATNGSRDLDDATCATMGCGGTSTSYVPPEILNAGQDIPSEIQASAENEYPGSPLHPSAYEYSSGEATAQQHVASPQSIAGSQQPPTMTTVPPTDAAPNTYESTMNYDNAVGRDTSSNSSKFFGKSNSSYPSFNFGWGQPRKEDGQNDPPPPPRRPQTPLAALMDPPLMIFTAVVFFFHLSNSSVLPLVMQSLALQDPQAGILLSGLCIVIAQAFMSFFAKICGDYTPIWGRKNLTLLGLFSLTIRCFLLTFLVSVQEEVETEAGDMIVKALILSTQLLDSVGAGIFGTLHVLITNDISSGTGRFSLMLGITTGAMCLGGTVSGYIGQALAQDYGYPAAFSALGMMSLIPFFVFGLCMGETLPDYVRPKPMERRKRLLALLQRLNNQRKKLAARYSFVRRVPDKDENENDGDQSQPGYLPPSKPALELV